MARKPGRFIEMLTEDEYETLQVLYASAESSRVRQRAHTVLLSFGRHSIDEIAEILGVSRDTVCRTLDRWDNHRFDQLADAPRSGAHPLLNSAEVELLLEIARKFPHSLKQVLQKLHEVTGKTISRTTLQKILREAGLTWKRMRKSLKDKRDETKFRKGQVEVQRLEALHDLGEIDLFFCDESGFSLTPTVPYGWQPVGATIELPSSRSPRLNTFGFLDRDHRFASYTVEGNIDSGIVISCIDEFSQTLTKRTVVVIDNASVHTSKAFEARIPEWKKKGLTFYKLPPYCPELNLIERLWKMIKYHWLPLNAYASFNSLREALASTLFQIGRTLHNESTTA
jgi:transposase